MDQPVSRAALPLVLAAFVSSPPLSCDGGPPPAGSETGRREQPPASVGARHDHSAPAERDPVPAPAAAAAGSTLEELVAALKEGDEAAREGAARAIGERGAAARPALGALVDAFRDAEPNVRMAAARAAGALGAEAAGEIPRLIDLFDDPASFTGECGCTIFPVRIEASRALARIGAAALEPVLDQARHGQAHRREFAAMTLGAMKYADPRVAAVLKGLLEDGDRRVRDKAREALQDLERAQAAGSADR